MKRILLHIIHLVILLLVGFIVFTNLSNSVNFGETHFGVMLILSACVVALVFCRYGLAKSMSENV